MTARDDNRAAFPFAAQILDQFRDVFGDGVKITYARQGDREIGRRFKYAEAAVLDNDTLPDRFEAKAPRLGKIRK